MRAAISEGSTSFRTVAVGLPGPAQALREILADPREA